MKHEESEAQQALFEWAALMRGVWPELELMYHVPNGGKRSQAEAARLKAEGVRAGVPDIVLPTARGGYFGLYIEMKTEDGRLSASQAAYIPKLEAQNYAVIVCRGFDEARNTIERYLGWGATEAPGKRGRYYGKL